MIGFEYFCKKPYDISYKSSYIHKVGKNEKLAPALNSVTYENDADLGRASVIRAYKSRMISILLRTVPQSKTVCLSGAESQIFPPRSHPAQERNGT